MDDMGLVIAFVVVAYLGIMILFWGAKPKRSSQTQTTTSPKKKELTPDDVMEVLNFMVAHNVIDTKEYNRLLVKASSFL